MTKKLLLIAALLTLSACGAPAEVCQNGECKTYNECIGPGNSSCVHCDGIDICGTFTVRSL